MTAPESRVGINIDWGETGSGVVDKATKELQGLGGAGGEAGASLEDRLGQAFTHLEAREPTMVLRRARMAIEELGASALGVTGPVGRMGASLAMLAPGGALTLGAIGGLAGIGFEIKKIIDLSGEIDATLTRGAEGFAKMGGASAQAYFQVGQLSQQIEDLSHAGFWETFMGLFSTGRGIGDIGSALQTQRLTEQATAENERILTMDRIHDQHQQVLDREQAKADAAAAALDKAAEALARVELGAHPSQIALDRLNGQIEIMNVGFEHVDDATKTRITRLLQEANAIKLATDASEERAAITRALSVRAGQRPDTRDEAIMFQAMREGRFGLDRAAPTRLGTTTTLGAAAFSLRTSPEDAEFFKHGPKNDPEFIRSIQDRDTLSKDMTDSQIARIVSTSAAAVNMLMRGGADPGSILGAGGTVLSSIKGMGIPGAVLSGLSSILGIGSTPKVIIARLEQEAMDQMKQVLQPAQNVSVVVAAANPNDPNAMRQTRYQLGRMGSRDAVTQLPYG